VPNRIRRISALARLIILDGLRRHALIGLILFALAGVVSGLLFFDFIPRDVGRAANDFLFSTIWLTGFILLLFHAVQVMAWDNERRALHTYLARPLSRTEYALALFFGIAVLLLALNLILGAMGWMILKYIRSLVGMGYFQLLSGPFFLLALAGLYCLQLMILSVILLFSSAVRGSFPVLLLTLGYYFIASGLPVVRQALRQKNAPGVHTPLDSLLQGLTAIFPDFTRLDFKTLVIAHDTAVTPGQLALPFGLASTYIIVVLYLACLIYQRRDLE